MSCFLRVNSLLISAAKSSVTLLTPDPAQANTYPEININVSEFPFNHSPNILGVYLGASFYLTLAAYKWPTESAIETTS